jgi:hypothetical protein
MRCSTVEVKRADVINILNNEQKGMQIARHRGELIGMMRLSLLQLLAKWR